VQSENPEDDVITCLVQWAEQQPLLRALLLTSSRANPAAPVDRLSDYDVIFVVSEMASFAQGEDWLRTFGNILVKFRGSDPRYEHEALTQLVVYEDGTKIDYTVWTLDKLKRASAQPALPDVLDVGYRVLLDKDALTASLQPPTYRAHIPRKPTRQEFEALVEEFWWETTYVAKNLWRGELFPAMYSFECVIKIDLLRRLLEWHFEIRHNWSIKPGTLGRGLKHRLKPELWAQIESTFVGADMEENWDALFRTAELFRIAAIEVAHHLGYDYLHALDERMITYLNGIRNLD
jgi:aminoglycoside 6-adenylyltransferase